MPSTDDELAAIRTRLDRATPGPWYVRFLDDNSAAILVAVSTEPDTGKFERLVEGSETLQRISPTLVAATVIQHPIRYLGLKPPDEFNDNAKFIAHARTDVARLVDEVARLRRQVEDLEGDSQRRSPKDT